MVKLNGKKLSYLSICTYVHDIYKVDGKKHYTTIPLKDLREDTRNYIKNIAFRRSFNQHFKLICFECSGWCKLNKLKGV